MKRILITTIDPLIVDYRPGVSNEHDSLDYIPASRLRGAFFEFRDKLFPGIDVENVLGYGGPRWTHAWPSDEFGKHWRVIPKCCEGKKGQALNWLRGQNTPFCSCAVKMETNMSVGRHYGRRAHRESALYAREAISPGQHFVAYVDCAELPNTDCDINIGTRRSANGLCHISISDSDVDFLKFDSSPGSNYPCPLPDPPNDIAIPHSAAIQLLSDAILPAPGGGYLRGLGKDDFKRLIGCKSEVDIRSAFSASKTVAGWAGPWGLPRESAVAIEAGSVWLLQVDANDDNPFRDFLSQCLSSGLGIRAYEGFGAVAVNPRWLAPEGNNVLACRPSPLKPCICTATQPAAQEHPPSWPEATGLTIEILNALIPSGKDAAAGLHRLKSTDVRQWMTAVSRNGATDHEKLPGRVKFDQAVQNFPLISNKLQAAQLLFLTVVESELIEVENQAAVTHPTPGPVEPPAAGGAE